MGASSGANNALAIGTGSSALGEASISIGMGAISNGEGAISLGSNTSSLGEGSVSLGSGSSADGGSVSIAGGVSSNRGVAIGSGAVANKKDEMNLGGRTLSGLKAGETSDSAEDGSYLGAGVGAICRKKGSCIVVGGVRYDSNHILIWQQIEPK